MVTIKDVEACFKQTLRIKATPHRTPDFKKLYKTFPPETPVVGVKQFLEEHNTGYDGFLERWEFRIKNDDRTTRCSFWADLLPGLIVSVRQ